MSAPPALWSEPVRLNQIGAGLDRSLVADAAVRARIAKAFGLSSLDSLAADLDLAPSPRGWTLKGRLRAELAQTCGVTLEPLPMTVDDAFSITLAEQAPDTDGEIVVSLDDEVPDLIEDGRIDLGQYVVEQLALHLDPFPRKPGAEFVQPAEPAEISPFAVLQGLKPDAGVDPKG